jgi:hypothetical protein
MPTSVSFAFVPKSLVPFLGSLGRSWVVARGVTLTFVGSITGLVIIMHVAKVWFRSCPWLFFGVLSIVSVVDYSQWCFGFSLVHDQESGRPQGGKEERKDS